MTTAGFATMMAAEIAEQPAAVRRTLDELLPLRDDVAALVRGRRHVLFVARGSSDNAAVYGRYLLETQTPLSAALAAPSVATHYRTRRDLGDTVVVSLSQSGETGEIIETQEWAQANGAATIAVSNDATSRLATAADLALTTAAGVERAVPATKSYLTQLAAVAVLVSALCDDPGHLAEQLAGVPEQIEHLLRTVEVSAVVECLAAADDVLVTGRGLVLGTALEAALKLEETCLQPVRALSYADLRHGPMAVVDASLVAVVFAAQDGPLLGAMGDLCGELRRRGAQVVGIGGDAAFGGGCDVAVPGPRLPEPVAPLGLVVPAQLAVEAFARRIGLDPDAPRGLSKVTQTDPQAAS